MAGMAGGNGKLEINSKYGEQSHQLIENKEKSQK